MGFSRLGFLICVNVNHAGVASQLDAAAAETLAAGSWWGCFNPVLCQQ